MVKFLHPQQLAHIRITLLLVVLHVVNIAKAEVVQLFLELLDRVLELLHLEGMLLYKLFDRLQVQVKVHLDGCEQLSHDITNHATCDVIKLVIKVRFLKLNNPLQHVLRLVVAVFEDEVLRLFHLLHLIELIFEAFHGVLG